MATTDTQTPAFTVENEFFGGQARLVPEFADGDLSATDRARYGHLRNRFRGRAGEVVLPMPFGDRFEAGERVALEDVNRRVANGQRDAPRDLVTTAAVVAFLAVSVVLSRALLALLSLLD